MLYRSDGGSAIRHALAAVVLVATAMGFAICGALPTRRTQGAASHMLLLVAHAALQGAYLAM